MRPFYSTDEVVQDICSRHRFQSHTWFLLTSLLVACIGLNQRPDVILPQLADATTIESVFHTKRLSVRRHTYVGNSFLVSFSEMIFPVKEKGQEFGRETICKRRCADLADRTPSRTCTTSI